MNKLSLLIVCALSSACGLLDGGGDDDAPIIAGDWPVDRPMKETVAPGEIITLHLTNVDADKADLFVWIDEEHAVRPADFSDGDVADDGDITIDVWAPFFREGTQTMWIGDAERPRTGAIELVVDIPAPRVPKAEAARLFAAGMDQFVVETQKLIGDQDPTWQAAWGSVYDSTERGNIDAMFTGMHDLRADLEANYLALSDEDEAALQSFLEQRGILRGFEEVLGGTTARILPDATTTIFDRANHPLARILYTLDFTSTLTSVAGDTLSYVAIIAIWVPGLQPIAGVAFEAQMIPHMIRIVIDNLVPTDLYDIDTIQAQPEMYRGQGHRTYYWGTFSTEQQEIGDLFTSLDNAVATLAGLAFGKRGGLYVQGFKDLALAILAKAGVRLPALFNALPSQKPMRPTINTVLNMALYNLNFSDLVLLMPMGTVYKSAFAWIPDPELVDPFFVTPDPTDTLAEYSSGADIYMTYGSDTMYFEGIDWPTTAPNQRVHLNVVPYGYRYTTKEKVFFSIPTIELTPHIGHTITARYGRDPGDPSSTTEDPNLLLTTIPGDTTYQGWFDRLTPTSMVVPITVQDLAGGRLDVARVTIKVNFQVQHTDVHLISGGQLALNLTLERGQNLVEIVALAGHATQFDAGGFPISVPVQVHVPQADQLDKSRTRYLNVGETGSFMIVTPPKLSVF